MVFQRLRRRNGISEEDYIKSLGPEQILNSFWTTNYETLYEQCYSGQQGSLFYYSKDRRYMLKTIKKSEVDKLMRILEPYYRHMKHWTESLISRYYGLH